MRTKRTKLMVTVGVLGVLLAMQTAPVARQWQYQYIDCIGGRTSPDAGCDPAKANRCGLHLHAS
jgi:hypothetical protein